MRIGSLADMRKRPRAGLVPSGSLPSLDSQVADFYTTLASPRLLIDPSFASTRFQDTAATSLVTTDGQSIARLNDRSGSNNHIAQATSASMPIYRTDGTLHWAQADGSNDSWQSIATFDASSTDKVTIIAGVYVSSAASATGVVAELGIGSAIGSFLLAGPQTNAALAGMNVRGDGTERFAVGALARDTSSVLTGIADISGSSVRIRRNGVQTAQTLTSAGAGNLANATLNVLRRNGTSTPFNGRLYGLMIIGRLLTSDELSLCERWMASKTGISF